MKKIFENILPKFARLISTNLIWRFSFKLIDLVFKLIDSLKNKQLIFHATIIVACTNDLQYIFSCLLNY